REEARAGRVLVGGEVRAGAGAVTQEVANGVVVFEAAQPPEYRPAVIARRRTGHHAAGAAARTGAATGTHAPAVAAAVARPGALSPVLFLAVDLSGAAEAQ